MTATSTADGHELSRGMGWFGVALGLAELVAPRMIAKAIGVRADGRAAWLIRAFGARELIGGLTILFQPRRPMPVWARVAGDALDLATLGTAAVTRRTSTPRLIGAVAAVAGAAVADVVASQRVQRAYDRANPPVMAAVTINRPPQEVYEFYRKLERLPVFMDYLESVTEESATRSHWVACLPVGGGRFDWDADITADRPGQLIAWESTPESRIKVRGTVTFSRAPGRDATEVRVEVQLGGLGVTPNAALARWFARPQIRGDLRRLKQLIETGEVLRSDASAHRKPHPAQPAPDANPPPPIFLPRTPTAHKGAES